MVLNKSKGFTIIELIVVIAIIAILAAVIITNVSQYTTKSRDTAAMEDLNTLSNAGLKYYTANSNYDNFFYTTDNTLSPDYFTVSTALTNMSYSISTSCAGGSTNCVSDTGTTAWCASIQLKFDPTIYYCIDSTNKKEQGTGTASDICVNGACP